MAGAPVPDKEQLASNDESKHAGREQSSARSPVAPKPTAGSWRTKYPSILAPVNLLFPPVSTASGDTSLIADVPKRAAWKARKGLIRSLIVLVACYILLVDALTTLGNAAFFALIVSVMVPSNLPPLTLLLVGGMLVFGMLIGWAWGCAAMAAGLRARDQVLLASQLRLAQSSASAAANPSAAFRSSIFEGQFLFARTSVVYGCFLGVGTFFLGLMRAKAPKLALVSIFGSIVVDVMTSYGPLFPFAQYTLAYTFLVPTACWLAVALVASMLIFPETHSRTWTRDLVDSFLVPVLQRSQAHSKLLATAPPTQESSADWMALSPALESTQHKMSASLEALLGGLMFVKLEVSRGRLGAKDLASIAGKLSKLASSSMGLGVVFRTVARQHRRRFGEGAPSAPSDAVSIPMEDESSKKTAADHSTARMRRMRDRVTAAEKDHHSLGHLLPILAASSAALHSRTDEALIGSMEWLIRTNSARWFGQGKPEAIEQNVSVQKARISALEEELAAFRNQGRLKVCAPFKGFFDPATGVLLPGARPSPASLYVVLAASTNLILYCESVLDLVKHVSDLEDRRRISKLWWPSGLRKIGNLLKGSGKGDNVLGEETDPDTITLVDHDHDDDEGNRSDGSEKKEKTSEKGSEDDSSSVPRESGRRDPDALPPRNGRERMGVTLYRCSTWLRSPEVIFALKYSLGSVLLWLPQVFKSSAYFTYVQKGLWALIMYQTGLAIYSGDQILQSIQKLAGTALGLVLGMLVWHAGAGTGRGSKEGLGVLVAVFMLPVLAFRLYAPVAVAQFAILSAVTTVLIIGYSWLGPSSVFLSHAPQLQADLSALTDAHSPQLGNPGLGYQVAWRRALLVLIGVGAATVAMLLPRPITSRSFVRRTHATCIDEIGRLYSSTISAWLSEERREDFGAEDGKGAAKLGNEPFGEAARKAGRARLLGVWTKLNSTQAGIQQAAAEPSTRGKWPKAQYTSLLACQLTAVQALAQLGISLTRLDRNWRRKLIEKTAFLNPHLVADCSSTFYLLSMALRAATPLPEATPGPLLDRLLYHDARLRKITDDEAPDLSHVQVEGAAAGDLQLTFDVLCDPEFATHASAILALANLLSAVDEMEEIVKDLCGTVAMPNYARLRQGATEV